MTGRIMTDEEIKIDKLRILANAIESLEGESDFEADLKDIAWAILHDNPGITENDWENELMYKHELEVADVFGTVFDEVTQKLYYMWLNESYEDELTGEKYKFCEWSEIFANKYSVEVYDKLAEEKLRRK